MRTHIAYSCDSTSWISGVRYGNIKLYHHGTLKTAHIRSDAYKTAAAEFVKTRPELAGAKPHTVGIHFAANSYKRYQDWLDRNYQWVGNK